MATGAGWVHSTRDKMGDILLGYSESCGNTCPGGTATFPSIYVAGRVASDALGTLEPEVQLVAGAGSQPDTSNRWGDYSSMRIDQDGCTFWYTQEYYKVTVDLRLEHPGCFREVCQLPLNSGASIRPYRPPEAQQNLH